MSVQRTDALRRQQPDQIVPARTDAKILPYNKDSNAGLFIVRDFVTYCYTGSQTYFTPKGKEVIRMKFQKKCGEELLPKIAR